MRQIQWDALGKQKEEEGNNWMSTTKQEFEMLYVEYIWQNGRNDDKEIWIRTRKRQRQNMEKMMRVESLLTLHNILINWEEEECIEVYMH
jgi:hypothetical protein